MKHYFFTIAVIIILIGCSDVVEVEDISGQRVELLAPADSITTIDTTLVFRWSNLTSADSYRIQIAQPNFENAVQVVIDSVITDSASTSPSINTTLSPNEYQWRVKAMNSAYETGYHTRSFTINE